MAKISNFVGKKSIEKEVKKMKKLLAVLTAMALVVSYAAPASAAFTRIIDPPDRYTATAAAGGTAGVITPFSLSLKKLSDDTTATEIGWNGITAGTTNWLNANQYVQAQGFASWETWGIQVYTHNTWNGTNPANPRYTGTENPAGLVRTDNTIYSLPMCWRTKCGYSNTAGTAPVTPGSTAITAQEKQIYQGTITVGSITMAVLYDGVPGHQPGGSAPYYPWFFMLDKLTPDVDPVTVGDQPFGDYQNEATFIGSRGYHHAPGTVNYATPSDPDDFYFVYFGACFTMAVPQKTYTTNSLYVEAYHL